MSGEGSASRVSSGRASHVGLRAWLRGSVRAGLSVEGAGWVLSANDLVTCW